MGRRLLPTGRALAMGGAASTTLNNDLVSFWKLDEASGTRTDDKGVYNFTSEVGSPANRTGKVDSAVDFDGTDGLYGAASNGYIDGATDWTLGFWFIYDATGSLEHLANVWGGIGRAWLLAKTATEQIQVFSNSVGTGSGLNTTFSSMDALSAGTWYHIVMRYDSTDTSAEIFINGASIGTHDGEQFANSSYVFAIGSLGNSASLNGGIDLMAFWQKKLTDAEILELSNTVKNQPF